MIPRYGRLRQRSAGRDDRRAAQHDVPRRVRPVQRHRLARRGFLFGGSTGTVVSGAMDWLSRHDASDLTAVAIAPDLGERYLDTIYQANWVADIYGDDVLRPGGLASGTRVR